MTKEEWKKRIIDSCEEAGTYKPFFEPVIDTLAGIMENRDKAHEQFVASGANPTIIHTNKAKEKNVVKNPILTLELDLDAQALAYWRDLGLTPSGLRRLKTEAMEEQPVTFEQVLAGIIGETEAKRV